jgi:hypothetical protein
MSGIFSRWQPEYAARGIATFPVEIVDGRKKPMLTNWHKIGLRGSTELAGKFTDADMLGYVTGRRSMVTVVDVDTTDERVTDDAIKRHGEPHIITRTASCKFPLLYRYNGERRRMRPWAEIDILGDGGFVVTAPSKIGTGTYEIIKGHIDDLDRLEPMRGIEAVAEQAHIVKKGARNSTLWRHCMRQAHHCDDFGALLDVARTFNESCQPALEDEEVMKIANSAWGYIERGENRFGQHGAYFPVGEVAAMLQDPDAFVLLAFLRTHNGPWATFMCTNTLTETFSWDLRRLRAARSRLIELGYMTPVRQAGCGHPALFRWSDREGVSKNVHPSSTNTSPLSLGGLS